MWEYFSEDILTVWERKPYLSFMTLINYQGRLSLSAVKSDRTFKVNCYTFSTFYDSYDWTLNIPDDAIIRIGITLMALR